MNDEQVDRIGQTPAGGVASRRTVLAVLASASLLLTGWGATLAAGTSGGASGADAFQSLATVTRDGSKLGVQPDRTARLSGKLGVGTGDD